MERVMKTYQVTRGRRWQIVSEIESAWHTARRRDWGAYASEIVRRRDLVLSQIADAYKVKWKNVHLLDVGCGQGCTWSLAFGSSNHVTAIDLDVVPNGLDPRAYWAMLRSNGGYRVAKTLARKVLGIDRRQRPALEKALGGQTRWPQILRMDACELSFPDNTFDGAFSFAVFEHLEDPSRVLRELNRVVKDGRLIYVVLELFTSIAGSHDPRLWKDIRALPLWAHLRPSCNELWQSNVVVNQLRMADFERIARETLTDVRFFYHERETRKYLAELSLQVREELAEYTDKELCTQDLVIVGRAQSSVDR